MAESIRRCGKARAAVQLTGAGPCRSQWQVSRFVAVSSLPRRFGAQFYAKPFFFNGLHGEGERLGRRTGRLSSIPEQDVVRGSQASVLVVCDRWPKSLFHKDFHRTQAKKFDRARCFPYTLLFVRDVSTLVRAVVMYFGGRWVGREISSIPEHSTTEWD